MKPFPKTAFAYLYEVLKPYRKAILFTTLLQFFSTSIHNLTNWYFAQIVNVTKQGPSEQAFNTALVFIALMSVCGILNVLAPRKTFLYRQFNLYLPVTL